MVSYSMQAQLYQILVVLLLIIDDGGQNGEFDFLLSCFTVLLGSIMDIIFTHIGYSVWKKYRTLPLLLTSLAFEWLALTTADNYFSIPYNIGIVQGVYLVRGFEVENSRSQRVATISSITILNVILWAMRVQHQGILVNLLHPLFILWALAELFNNGTTSSLEKMQSRVDVESPRTAKIIQIDCYQDHKTQQEQDPQSQKPMPIVPYDEIVPCLISPVHKFESNPFILSPSKRIDFRMQRSQSIEKTTKPPRYPTRQTQIFLGEDSNVIKEPIFDLIPLGIITINLSKEITFFNRKAQLILQTDNQNEMLDELREMLKQPNLIPLAKVQQKLGRIPSLVFNQDKSERMLAQSVSQTQILNSCDPLDALLRPDSNPFARPWDSSAFYNQGESSSFSNQSRLRMYEIEHVQKGTKRVQKLLLQLVQNSSSQEDVQFNQQNGNSLIIIIQDVTKKRNHHELQQRFKFQNELLLSFSHELRTPLNSSIQLLSMAIDNIPGDVCNNLIKPAYNSNMLLLYQLNDILDYAAFLTNSFKYNHSEFRIKEVFKDICQLLEPALKHKNINFDVIIKDQLQNRVILSDKQRLIQVLVALLNNSMKFTHYGGSIAVRVGWNALRATYKFSISDNGTGMIQQQLEAIQTYLRCSYKDITYDFHDKTIRIGLGLKISNKLVGGLGKGDVPNHLRLNKQHQGLKISFKIFDRRQQGYNFQTLDQEFSEMEDSSVQPIRFYKRLTANPFTGGCKCSSILVVDDEPFNQLALKQLLSSFQLSCQECYDGQSAVEYVKQRHRGCCRTSLRLIIMDIQMPYKDGLQASKEIISHMRKQNSTRIQPVIVICSAYDTLDNQEDAKLIGVQDFLNKPVRKSALQAILKKYNLI